MLRGLSGGTNGERDGGGGEEGVELDCEGEGGGRGGS